MGASGWLGRPATAMLKAESLSHAVIDVGGSSALASVRLRDAIRPDEDTVVVNLAGLKWGGFDDQLAADRKSVV